MHKLAASFAASGLLTFGAPASGELLVSDSFESGDMSTTSAAGFRWSDTKVTSVVTADTEVFVTSPVNLPAPETSQWEAKTGDHALMLRYRAEKSWTEQKFHLSEPQPDLWMDGYGQKGDGSTVGMSFRGDGQGGSYFFGKIAGSGDKGRVPFIKIPRDRSRWMHLVVHVDSESSPGKKDGVMEVWRKWEGDADYTKTHDFKEQRIKLSSTKKNFASRYLMGWANAAYRVMVISGVWKQAEEVAYPVG